MHGDVDVCWRSSSVAPRATGTVETGSRWQQSTGEAIDGPLKGSTLTLYDFVLTTWKEWRTRYPNTQVMKPMPGYLERFDLLRSRVARSRSGEGAAPEGSFSKDDRLRPRELVAGLAVGNETMAFPVAALRVARVVNERLGGVPIVVIHQPESETTTAYEARVKDRVLRFDAANAGATSVFDRETHSTWNAYGLATKGPLKGTQLKPLIRLLAALRLRVRPLCVKMQGMRDAIEHRLGKILRVVEQPGHLRRDVRQLPPAVDPGQLRVVSVREHVFQAERSHRVGL